MTRVALFRRSSWQALGALLVAIVGLLAAGVASAVIRGGGPASPPTAAARHPVAPAHRQVRTAAAPRRHRAVRGYYVTPQNAPQVTFPPAQASGVDLNPGSVGSSLPPAPGQHFDRRAPGARYSAPGPAGQQGAPGPVALRLDDVNESGYLARPGLAISAGTIGLSPGSSVSFYTGPVKRTAFDGAPVLVRLHLKDNGNVAVTLTLTLDSVTPSGVRQQIDSGSVRVSAAIAKHGPESNANGTLPALSGALPRGHDLELTILEDAGVAAPSSVTLYYGVLPGQDTGFNQDYQRSEGGPNPARLTVGVTDTRGAFSGD